MGKKCERSNLRQLIGWQNRNLERPNGRKGRKNVSVTTYIWVCTREPANQYQSPHDNQMTSSGPFNFRNEAFVDARRGNEGILSFSKPPWPINPSPLVTTYNQDANNLLAMLWTWQNGDISRTPQV